MRKIFLCKLKQNKQARHSAKLFETEVVHSLGSCHESRSVSAVWILADAAPTILLSDLGSHIAEVS